MLLVCFDFPDVEGLLTSDRLRSEEHGQHAMAAQGHRGGWMLT